MKAQCFVHPNPPRGQNLTKTCGLAQPRINENKLFANPDAHERPTSYENNWFSLTPKPSKRLNIAGKNTHGVCSTRNPWKAQILWKHMAFACPDASEKPKICKNIWLCSSRGTAEAPRRHRGSTRPTARKHSGCTLSYLQQNLTATSRIGNRHNQKLCCK